MIQMFALSLAILVVMLVLGTASATYLTRWNGDATLTRDRVVKSVVFVWCMIVAGTLIFWQWVIFVVMHFIVKAW